MNRIGAWLRSLFRRKKPGKWVVIIELPDGLAGEIARVDGTTNDARDAAMMAVSTLTIQTGKIIQANYAIIPAEEWDAFVAKKGND